MNTVALGMPLYGSSVCMEAAAGFYNATSGGCRVIGSFAKISLLAQSHNEMWCNALRAYTRGSATHFACLHSDVELPRGWLDTMLEEAQKVGADVLSLVLPIKDGRGLTSIARGGGQPFEKTSRITIRELAGLPQTFTGRDADCPNLLVNTGCLIVDLRRVDWLSVDEAGYLPAWFQISDRVSIDNDGQLRTHVEPEDWHFSRCAARLGARIYATTAVKAYHLGQQRYPNFGDWGSVETESEHVSAGT